ncbi:transcription factor bHLH47-like [Andrographis paniculata]|uniref:transcription factor bHLH47-like n=1 Tax=Andrographis paniculata TaxID=175694 RepID=UPI0021E981EB|nr:transcription factor bHLH47-like [Andrographis paniculata]XP_051133031.1 transcription factor bHLH47-like [Andrographis paniculata]XP_051133032.1 transcription factor bHLH47-like [Andrographis paniculata]
MATDTSIAINKNHGKVPKRINKSQREKKKREHLNELFLNLANTLELSEQSSCKASVLIEATRLVRDTAAQIKNLEKENAALLSESVYITVETNELKDENSALEAEIGKLRTEIKSRVSDLQLDLNKAPAENQVHDPVALQHTGDPLVFQQGQFLNLVHLSEQVLPGHGFAVRKPHARYPTAADGWPSQVLEKQLAPERGKGARDGYRDDNCCV